MDGGAGVSARRLPKRRTSHYAARSSSTPPWWQMAVRRHSPEFLRRVRSSRRWLSVPLVTTAPPDTDRRLVIGTTVLGQVLENVRAFAAAMRGSYAAVRDETRPRTRLVDRA